MSAQSPTQVTALTSTDMEQAYHPTAVTGPALMAESAEMPHKPGIFHGTQSGSDFNALTGNTLAATAAPDSRINQQENSHIDLLALLIIAAVAGILSEITHRKQRRQKTRR
ncbi:MAG: hypothetical protein OEU78_08025 [Gammaproteobacteria bacterium]|nr:hypothetical protein [Gammaproteobacteria bacterium]MDH3935574.1 hypothetical protein [Gammaproteobacteria bacterium]